MPRRKPSRSQRRGGRKPPMPPPVATPAAQPVKPQAVAATPSAPERADEPSVTRFSTRDYSYVQRELQRIALLATAIIVVIIVLSFFFP